MWNKVLIVCLGLAALTIAYDDDNKDIMFEETQWLTNSTDVDFYVYEEGVQGRLINGQQAQRRQLPWHVIVEAIGGTGSSRLCAGSLISSHYVLSEANALRSAASYDVVIGAHSRVDRTHVRRSTQAFFHPQHVSGSGNYNIALVRLQRAFTEFSKYIKPVQLARPDTKYEARHTWISGFGTTTSTQHPVIQWAAVRVLSHDECKETFPGVVDSVFCTVGYDGYHSGPGLGDGGAPLVALEGGQYVQVGVYAFTWRNDFSRPVGYVSLADMAIRRWVRTVSGV